MAAPRMAPLTPSNASAQGPAQQMLAAALVRAAEDAPHRPAKSNDLCEPASGFPLLNVLFAVAIVSAAQSGRRTVYTQVSFQP